MRESCTYGSVRGAPSNGRPYRDRREPMQRREFIMLLGCAAATWPLAARAQQMGNMHRIGYLGPSSPSLERHLVDAFRQKLRELGHVEGENIAIEYRWAEGRDDRLPGLGGRAGPPPAGRHRDDGHARYSCSQESEQHYPHRLRCASICSRVAA